MTIFTRHEVENDGEKYSQKDFPVNTRSSTRLGTHRLVVYGNEKGYGKQKN